MEYVPHSAALVGGIAAAVWGAIIVALHSVKPSLTPSTHLISEYARPPHGWIMQVAFFCAALSCFALSAAAWPFVSIAGSALLTLVGLGFAGAGVFTTDPVFIGKGAETTSGKLHVLFAFATMLLFPIMATAFDFSASNSAAWLPIHSWLTALSVLPWLGLVVFLAVSVWSASHENAPVGYAERFLVLTFTAWLLVLAFGMAAS